MARFHVRARTVDMLGRQQIAGVPTAISELFKNAHDAYARNVEADFLREENLLVLRDDGLGMTIEDFERRWLTLGTDSKVGTVAGLPPPPIDPSQAARPILGEKGIGRLAVAILGPQLFVLSRARRNNVAEDKVVAAYLNWNLFAQPGLDLDEIEIPVREFSSGSLPDRIAVRQMVDEFAAVVEKLSCRIDTDILAAIRSELDCFDVDPAKVLGELGEPSLSGQGTGTHFFVKPVDEIIQDDIDYREDENKATKFEKHLLGFTNTMTPDFNPPPIVARFQDYPDEGAPLELIGETAFFTPEEYRQVDHHIFGRFDEFGQFRGTVGIYQTKPDLYVLNWNESAGRKTLCGPFDFSIAVIQGQASDSLLPPEEFARMVRKANRHGGIYVYRDGVRVQPYGDSDYDWLDIERRRTLGASYYFYSFRRMFGAIELTGESNGALKEKAGREGFIENRAYRQFRSILVNFFLQSAADFFREDGRRSDSWEENRAELQKNHDIRRRKARQASARKRNFGNALDEFFDQIEINKFGDDSSVVLDALKRKSEQVLKSGREPSEMALGLMRVEKEARGALHEIRSRTLVAKPRGVGLPRSLMNQWVAYTEESNRLEREVFGPVETEMEKFVSESAHMANVPLRHVSRIDAAVRARSVDAVGTVRRLRKASDDSVRHVAVLAHSTTRDSFRAVNDTVDQVVAELEQLKRSRIDVAELSERRKDFEERVDAVFELERDKMEKLKEHFDTIGRYWAKEGFDTLELTEALEEELEELRDQRELDLEMAQLGMAVNIVSHEFEKTVTTLRNGFRRMGAWANANPDLSELYKNMRSAFEHLDSYLVMFTPLDRRLHPVRVKISGTEVYAFLMDLFEQRLARHKVSLLATDRFRDFSVLGYPSSLYPVFANLVDNSVFWLQRVRDRSRKIELDLQSGQMIVRDNGPGVSMRDRVNIFMPMFSRKPGGRGMGLHVSRATLRKAGYDLQLDEGDAGGGYGATFRIEKREEAE